MEEPSNQYQRRSDDLSYSFLWALFQFKGRMNREEYWWSNGVLLGVSLVIFYVTFGAHLSLSEDNQILIPDAKMSQFLILMLASIYVTLAISVKRLHDLGAPSFAAVVFLFPFIGMIVFFLLGIIKGQPRDNKYGPMPPR